MGLFNSKQQESFSKCFASQNEPKSPKTPTPMKIKKSRSNLNLLDIPEDVNEKSSNSSKKKCKVLIANDEQFIL